MYKTIESVALLSFLLTFFSIAGCAAPEAKKAVKQEVTESAEHKEAIEYKKMIIEGWTVMISPAVQNDVGLHQPIVDQLNVDLRRVKSVVPNELLLRLQETVIWSEKSMPIKRLESLFFNGSRKMTKKYALVPDSYGGVILGKTKAYLALANAKPWGMLHELTHAYHQFHIRHTYAPIKLAFENTKKNDLHNPKSDKRISGSGYPTRNQKEYFSELTVAYFGKKLFYPHTRAELAEYDPLGYCAVVKAWGLQGKQKGDVPLKCNP